MKALSATVLTVASVPRKCVYDALLAEPGREWTVSQISTLLLEVSVEAVRTTIYLMLDDNLLDTVPHQRSLTVRLTAQGRAAIEQITAQWGTPDRVAEEQS